MMSSPRLVAEVANPAYAALTLKEAVETLEDSLEEQGKTIVICLGCFFILVLIEVSAQTNTSKFVTRNNKRVPNKGKQRGLGIGMFFLTTCQILALAFVAFTVSVPMFTFINSVKGQPVANAYDPSVSKESFRKAREVMLSHNPHRTDRQTRASSLLYGRSS